MRNNKLENAVTDVCLDAEHRCVYRIPFEEYINFWMKIATTNPEVLRRETLDELMRYTERFAAPYGSAGSESHNLIQAQPTCNTSVKKLQNKDKRKRKRLENMRRLYMQCKAPELLTPKIPAQDPDGLEHWDQEMDELVKWTHSLSLKELDDL